MGTSTVWQVTWNADLTCYQICEQVGQGMVVSEMEVDGDPWLERVSSFAFQSKDGTHVTALKERRRGGRVYWIAYRKIGGKLKRKYLGASKEVTLAMLEQVARVLAQQDTETTSAPSLVTSLTPTSTTDSIAPSSERVLTPLLSTKLLVPAPAHPLIRRSRLEALLNEDTRHPLTLVSAPAGFGKTSLLESWVQSLPPGGLQVAWVSLDKADNDVVRFWTYVLAALDTCEPGISQHALTLLRGPQAPALEYVLTMLINALLQVPVTQVLILDDYHVIREPAIHASLDFLLEHQPPQLRLILLSRADPPLKLSRLRARGQLLEVRDDDLRCSVEEAMQFLGEVMGIRLPNDVLQQVMTRTEGWLVGLQLLGLSLRGHADLTDLLDALAGTERYILDYLTEEVLGQQPASIQEFLLRTSILDPLSGPLCDAVLERTNSQDILEELERANVFVCSQDRQRRWFRYHALFAETLRYRLERTHALLVPTLHLHASQWYEQQGHSFEAVQHALLAKAWLRAADLIELASNPLIWKRSELLMLRRWIEQIPPEVVRSRPHLCFVYAWLQLFCTSPTAAEPWVKTAETTLAVHREASATKSPEEQSSQDNLLGEIHTLRALIAVITGDAQAGRTLSQQALAHLSEANLLARTEASGVQADAYGILGDLVSATQSALEATTLARAAGSVSQALHNMSRAIQYLYYRGRLREAWHITQQADLLGRGPDNLLFPLMSSIYFFQSYVPREWNQLDIALEIARQSTQLSEQAGFMTVAYIGYTALLEVQLVRGDLEATAATFERAEQILVTHLQDSWFLRALFLTEPQVRFWLARGETERAARWIEAQLHRLDRRPAPLARAREELARVRVLLAQHKGEEALRYLAPLLEEATTRDWGHFVIKIRLLQALAYQMQKAEGKALDSLAQAVHLAEPEGYLRSFVDEGPHMATLLSTLRDQQHKRGPTPYLDTVLATFVSEMSTREGHPEHGGQQWPQPLLDPLSERELDVLQMLAQGASNQDIAEALVIAVDTVKRHVSNILGKLEANNRMQAVVRARSLGLLSDQA